MPIDVEHSERSGADSGVSVRPVELDDSLDILRWRNDAATRAMSINGDEISDAVHQQWFRSLLANQDSQGFVGTSQGVSIGWVRFDSRGAGRVFRTSIVVAPEHRARGRGTALLRAAIDTLVLWKGAVVLEAEIKRENAASISLFRRVGFSVLSETDAILHLGASLGIVPSGSAADMPTKLRHHPHEQ